MTLKDDDMAGLTEAERAALADDGDETNEVNEPDAEPTELRADPLPLLNVRAPENAGEVLSQLAYAEAEFQRQFEEGDITGREYAEGISKLSEQRDEVRWSQRKAELANEMVETAKASQWNCEVESFMTTTAKDITAKGEPALLAFDAIVKKVTADPANQRLSDRAQLEKARREFLADFGPAFDGQSAHEEPASYGGGGGDKFAQLDRLMERDPLAYEEAIGRLSDAERRAYGL